MATARAFSMNSAESPCCADTYSAIALNIVALFAFAGKAERCGVDAVAKSRRSRAIREHVTQMAATTRAGHFNPPHAVTRVLVLYNGFGVCRKHKAGPSAAGVELGAAHEKQRAAGSAMVVARLVILGEQTGKWALGAFLAQHVILLRGQQRSPLRIAPDDFGFSIVF